MCIIIIYIYIKVYILCSLCRLIESQIVRPYIFKKNV